jgi:hypothetical protein
MPPKPKNLKKLIKAASQAVAINVDDPPPQSCSKAIKQPKTAKGQKVRNNEVETTWKFFDQMARDDTISTQDILDRLEIFKTYKINGKTPPRARVDLLSTIQHYLEDDKYRMLLKQFIKTFDTRNETSKNLKDWGETLNGMWCRFTENPIVQKAMKERDEFVVDETDFGEEFEDLVGPEGTEIQEDVVQDKPKRKRHGSTLHLPDNCIIKIDPNDPTDLEIEETGDLISWDDVSKPKKIPKFKSPMYINQGCFNDWLAIEWVPNIYKDPKNIFSGVYIAPLLPEHLLDLDQYISKKITTIDGVTEHSYKNEIQHEQDTFYGPINMKFIELLCNSTINPTQKGDIFSISTPDGTIQLKLGYRLDNGNIQVQDEQLWKTKQNYTDKKQKKTQEEIEENLKLPPDNKLINLFTKLLSYALKNIAPNVSDYNTDSPYIEEVIRLYAQKSPTSRDFINNLVDLLVYIKDDNTKTFDAKLQKMYYLPEILVDLTPEEKYPEALLNPDPKYITQNLDFIKQISTSMANNIIQQYYNNKYIYCVEINRGQTQNQQKIKNTFTQWKDYCVNRYTIVDNFPPPGSLKDSEVIFYKSKDGLIWCLIIEDLVGQYLNNKRDQDGWPIMVNRYNNEPLPKDFVGRFAKVYGKLLKPNFDIELDETPPVPKPGDEIKETQEELTPGFYELIMQDIGQCERQAAKNGPGKPCVYHPVFTTLGLAHSDSDSDDESSSSSVSTVDEEGRRVAEEGRRVAEEGRRVAEEGQRVAEEGQRVEEEGQITDMRSQAGKDAAAAKESNMLGTPSSSMECEECETAIPVCTLKTIKWSETNQCFREAYFCSIKCFENDDHWKKPGGSSCKKVSKKGGRKKTTDS